MDDRRLTVVVHRSSSIVHRPSSVTGGLFPPPSTRILEWAAQEGRIVLTHDRKTFVPFAYERVATGQPMPGVCVVKATAPIGTAIEYILLLLEIIPAEEWENQVRFVPL